MPPLVRLSLYELCFFIVIKKIIVPINLLMATIKAKNEAMFNYLIEKQNNLTRSNSYESLTISNSEGYNPLAVSLIFNNPWAAKKILKLACKGIYQVRLANNYTLLHLTAEVGDREDFNDLITTMGQNYNTSDVRNCNCQTPFETATR